MPLSLGYLFATEQHTHRDYEASNQYNLSEQIINANTPYYGDYTGSTNNSTIYTNNAGSYSVGSPDYIEKSSNPSSLPIYDYETIRISNLPQEHPDRTINVTENKIIQISNSAGDVHADFTIEYPNISYVTFGPRFQTEAYATVYIDGTEINAEGPIFYNVLYSSETQKWSFTLQPDRHQDIKINYDDVTNFYILSINTLQVWPRYYTYFNPQDYSDLSSTIDINAAEITNIQTGKTFALTTNTYRQNSSYFIVGDETYAFSEYTVKLYLEYPRTSTTYNKLILTTDYANPASGWSIFDTSGHHFWANQQLNKSTTIYVKLLSGDYTNIAATNDLANTYFELSIINIDGTIYINNNGSQQGITDTKLGEYEYLAITIDRGIYTVSGIKQWPEMYQPPVRYNTLEFSRQSTEDFTLVLLDDTHNVEYRVDTANIIAGSFPSTKDLLYDITKQFPDVGFQITFNSIAFYGEDLTVYDGEGNPTNIDLINGRISLQGQTFPLRGSTWIWEPQEDNTFILKINNYLVFGEGITQLPQIYFGGEWSLILTGYSLKPITVTTNDFAVGQFQFGTEGFAAAGVVTSCQGFCVLGLTGRMSLSKVAILALVFGGAVAVYLMEI